VLSLYAIKQYMQLTDMELIRSVYPMLKGGEDAM
jgi:hypothetical protein